MPYTITPLNEGAALISFGNQIDIQVNLAIISLHQRLMSQPFPGFIESAPAYASLAVFYDPAITRSHPQHDATAFDVVREYIEHLLAQEVFTVAEEKKAIIEIPVLYDGEDLPFVGAHHHRSQQEVISLHTAATYRVYMLGFLPGFAYLGSLDERIATPRKNSPRTLVPAGSVGIAGRQTGVYPQSSPGGWQLIGRCPIKIFDQKKSTPCLMSPGDLVHFYSIDPAEFARRNEY